MQNSRVQSNPVNTDTAGTIKSVVLTGCTRVYIKQGFDCTINQSYTISVKLLSSTVHTCIFL